MGIKEIVKITLFGVVGFVLQMVGGAITGLFGTYAMFIHASIGAILTGPIFIVMCHKLHKKGVAFFYYTISGIIYLVMGMWPMTVVMLLAGIIAELIISVGGSYENDFRMGVGFVVGEVVYSLHGFFFILVFGIKGLVKQFPSMFNLEAAQRVSDTFMNPKNLIIILAIEIICAILGALFGNYIYKKFFSGKDSKKKILAD